ncbi:MFS transporter [Streptomyces sp. NPDC097619]|uniref:MFS transporter n=1 Tax=Streptomyces sp. NPDC097619 TaxID=3157228 RepID=UPI0033315F4F
MAAQSVTGTKARPSPVRSTVPQRMDRLPWSRFHWKVVIALGITWVLDGIEITIAGSIADRLRDGQSLGFSSSQIGLTAGIYLLGEVVGALFFGRLADRLGRRNLFLVTLAVYLVGNGLTALSMNFAFFAVTRFIAGMGIGGEYAALNSAIDELIPSRHRGAADLAVNSTYWLGAMIGAAANLAFLNTELFAVDLGWRLGLLVGPLIGLSIWGLRRNIPESPRWLLTHGRPEEAERIVDDIERQVTKEGVHLDPVPDSEAVTYRQRPQVSYRELARILFRDHRRRSVLGFMLMVTQAFLYNAIFFTYALILAEFYDIRGGTVAYFIFPFALGNLAGPLLLGRYFDTLGRRRMIGATYSFSGTLLLVTGWLFAEGMLTAVTQTVLWCVIFFVASAAASSAYLTVSEIFPLEMRAQAISFFFALSMLFGGVVAPWLFATLIGEGQNPWRVFAGYAVGGLLMIAGGVTAFFWGVDAERRSLESIAAPLSTLEVEDGDGDGASEGDGGGSDAPAPGLRKGPGRS